MNTMSREPFEPFVHSGGCQFYARVISDPDYTRVRLGNAGQGGERNSRGARKVRAQNPIVRDHRRLPQ